MDSGTTHESSPINKYLVILLFLLIIPVVFLLQGGLNRVVIGIFLTPLLFLFIYNTRIVAGIIILTIFVEVYFRYFYVAEYLSILLLFSFLITHKFHLSDLKSPVLIPFLIFIISVIPSYLYSQVPGMSLLLSTRLIFFLIVFTLTGLILTKYEHIKNLISVFLFASLANGLYVIFLAVTTGDRVFGFTGIMYVDLVSISFIICFISFIYIKKNRIFYAVLGSLFFAALIFTQTRGVWLVTGFTTILIIFQSFFNTARIGISKLKMFFTVGAAAVVIISMIFLLQNVNPGAFERVTVQKKEANQSKISSSTGSIATRFFIWTTAWNAFRENPMTGTGLYTFPYVSSSYSDFNSETYRLFVDDLTAHTSILALLSEVGIIGSAGFMVFLISTLLLARRNVKNSITPQQWTISQIIFWISIYILFSMVITDAWLWGVLNMLWAIIIGMSIANSRILDIANEN